MKAIITGGSGLIGQALIKEFTGNGYDVIVLSRSPERTGGKLGGAEVVHWDGRTQGDWVKYIDGAAAVINLAGASIAGDNVLKMRWTAKRKTQIHESRVNAGEAITEAIRSVERKSGVLVQSSAVGIYGPLGDEIVDEGHPLADDYLANVCRDWEESTKAVEGMGVRRVILRTGLVFSKEGGIFPLLRLPFSLFIGGTLGSGKQYLSWIHIDDAAGAIRHLIEHQHAVGTYNLTSPDPVSNKVFSQKMGVAMKRPTLLPVPSFAMKLALGEVSTLALDGQRVVPARLLEAGYIFKHKKLEEALVELL